ncbi:MAG: hypothetical protein JKY60_08080 [Kordiimonadaceae bacterium]|nr:hypothetical protein [Kordiimonadaceae bacterium]
MAARKITGTWVIENGQVRGDEACDKIKSMLDSELEEIAAKDGGWTKLYRDKENMFWEFSYPQSYMHGGGPPQLERLSITSVGEWR